MPNYFFEKCDKNALKGIEKLAIELGLKEQEDDKFTRQWEGEEVFKREENYDRILSMTYSLTMVHPLLVQTSPNVTHRQQDVKLLIKRVMKICGVKRIYFDETETYDIQEFL